jgi:hypothetical protein
LPAPDPPPPLPAPPPPPHPPGRLWPRNEEDRAAIHAAGLDCERILGIEDLVAGDDVSGGGPGRAAAGRAQGTRPAAGAAATGRIATAHSSPRAPAPRARARPRRLHLLPAAPAWHSPTPSPLKSPPAPLTPTPLPTQVFFAATGVSDGDLVKGVRFTAGGATTSSIVMRARSGTVRYIESQHR